MGLHCGGLARLVEFSSVQCIWGQGAARESSPWMFHRKELGRLVGRLSVLECSLWGFLLLFALVHLFPLLCLFVTQELGRDVLGKEK